MYSRTSNQFLATSCNKRCAMCVCVRVCQRFPRVHPEPRDPGQIIERERERLHRRLYDIYTRQRFLNIQSFPVFHSAGRWIAVFPQGMLPASACSGSEYETDKPIGPSTEGIATPSDPQDW